MVKQRSPRNQVAYREAPRLLGRENSLFSFKLLAKFLELATANGKTDVLWSRNKGFGAVDHEVRTLDGAFMPEALWAIIRLEEAKEHINSGRFGKRCMYVISGLHVAVTRGNPLPELRRKDSKVYGLERLNLFNCKYNLLWLQKSLTSGNLDCGILLFLCPVFHTICEIPWPSSRRSF